MKYLKKSTNISAGIDNREFKIHYQYSGKEPLSVCICFFIFLVKPIYIQLYRFRYDYVDMQSPDVLPGFNRFLKEGVRAEYMSPIFPSISYPNWNTLLTGLWAESHGIVGNYMYDYEDQSTFDLHEPTYTTREKVIWKPIWKSQEIRDLMVKYFFLYRTI